MAATKALSFTDLARSVAKGADLAPVYILHGEEGFYIDRLIKIFENLVPEADRDFNLYNLYATQTPMSTVYETCRRFPMMADRQVVILKEMQEVSTDIIKKLAPYVANPSPQTVLVIVFRGVKAKGKEMLDAARASGGVIFESARLRDAQVGSEISRLLKERGLNIEPRGLAMMTEHVGADLSKIYNEVEKLAVALPAGAMVTPDVVERHVGISKTYNIYELSDAIMQRDAAKAFTILKRLAAEPKTNSFVAIITSIFGKFADLTVCHFAPDKSPSGLAAATGASEWAVKRLIPYMRNYNAWQVIEILGIIRRTDAMTKGIGSRRDPYSLITEMVSRIFYATGKLPY